MNLTALILTLAIISGQLIKLPLSDRSGLTLLDIITGILCLTGLINLKFKLKKPSLFLGGGLLFILIAVLSLALTPLHLLPQEKLISFFYTVRFAMYIFLGWLIASGALPSLKNNINSILISSGLGLAVLGLTQFVFLPDLRFLTQYGWDPHFFRTVSTFLDPNFAGAYFTLTLLGLTPYLKARNKITWRVLFMFTIVYITLLTTFSRGAYLAFFLSFLTLALLSKSFKLGIITLLLSFGLLLGFQVYQTAVAIPRGVDRTRSAELRLNTWQQGGTIFRNHLLLGIGFNAYRYALEQYSLGDEKFLSSRGSSTNDSSLLFVAATTGIIGLSGFAFFLSSLIWQNRYNPILITGIAGLLIQSFFSNTLFYPFNLIWIILISSLKIHD